MSVEGRELRPEAALGEIRGAGTVFSDYASVTGARVLSLLLSAVWVVLATRILAPDDYATFAYFSVVSILIVNVSASWTATAVARYGREAIDAHGEMIDVTWARALIVAPLFATSAVVLVALKQLGALPSDFSWLYLLLALIAASVLVIGTHLGSLLEAAGRMKLSGLGLAAGQALSVAVLLGIFLSRSSASAALVAGATVLSSALVAAAFARVLWRTAIWPPAASRATLRRTLLFSVPLIAFAIGQSIIGAADLIVIRAFSSAERAGIYAVAYQAYASLQQVAAAAPVVLVPLLVSLRTANRESTVRLYLERIAGQITFVAATLAGLAIPLLGVLVPLVFGERFAAAANPLAILLIASVLFFSASLVAPVLVLYERTRTIGYVTLAAAAANVALDILLVGLLGMPLRGAAIATVSALAIVWVGYYTAGLRLVGSRRLPQVQLLFPALGGLLPTLALDGTFALVGGLLGAIATALLVIVLGHPFRAEDARIVEALDMPDRLKAVVLRGFSVMAR